MNLKKTGEGKKLAVFENDFRLALCAFPCLHFITPQAIREFLMQEAPRSPRYGKMILGKMPPCKKDTTYCRVDEGESLNRLEAKMVRKIFTYKNNLKKGTSPDNAALAPCYPLSFSSIQNWRLRNGY